MQWHGNVPLLPNPKPKEARMKQTNKLKVSALGVAAVALAFTCSTSASTVIGSWQTSTSDGWIDWGNQLSITDPANAGKYSFASGAVPGYAQSLQITHSGWNQNLAIKLQNNGYVADFMNNQLLSFTFSVPAGTGGGWSQLFELAINAQGYGWNGQPFNANWSSTGDNSNNNGTQPNFYFWAGSPVQSQRVTLNYSSILSSMPANPGWIELVFSFNNGGGAPNYFYINDVTLSQVPEPSSLALLGISAAGLALARRRFKA
jgi:hypothetical protein